ncbi:MAG: 3'(2'),5'-bisphosphate nucleotidase CysQ [Chthoniobacterales bacterium]
MIAELLQIAREAGEVILSHYGQEIPAEKKADDSPLTLADRASHAYIVEALERLTPDVPIISEEGELAPHAQRQQWDKFWLVDPLDGTKEFIKQTGEFTVNIGLVANGIPTVGVVHAPAIKTTYWTDGTTAWKAVDAEDPVQIHAGRYESGASPTIVASRDHAGPEVTKLVEANPTATLRSMGSSLKFCLVAEGAADIYLRDVPTMEWDTAAAHAVVRAAGASLRQIDGEELPYNKSDVRNGAIVTLRSGADALIGEEG